MRLGFRPGSKSGPSSWAPAPTGCVVTIEATPGDPDSTPGGICLPTFLLTPPSHQVRASLEGPVAEALPGVSVIPKGFGPIAGPGLVGNTPRTYLPYQGLHSHFQEVSQVGEATQASAFLNAL